jgi:hypothetical protein
MGPATRAGACRGSPELVSSARTLSLCKMCARLADYRTRLDVPMCNECRDYMLTMADKKWLEPGAGPWPIPPWELTQMRRAQEHIENDLAESMLF